MRFSKLLIKEKNYWKKKYQEIPDNTVKEFQMEKELLYVIERLYSYQHFHRYVDKHFVVDFLHHKDDIPYKKAILLYRDILEKDVKFFPELTPEQAIQWCIKDYVTMKEAIVFCAYHSLLTNLKHRYEIFGF